MIEGIRHRCNVVKRVLLCADSKLYLHTRSGATEIIQCHCALFPSLQRNSIMPNNVEMDRDGMEGDVVKME